MGEVTGIEWTDKTHNFWYGCQKVSPGCKFCYAERDMSRFPDQFNFNKITRAKGFDKPLSWKTPSMVFVNSWSDFFIEDADPWRPEAWKIIRETPHLIYQILTKRPELIHARLPEDWGAGYPNVWLGVSVENNKYRYRIDDLSNIPAYVRFVSYEPALGPLDIRIELDLRCVDWVISGGESGPSARPADESWFITIRNQCRDYGIPYFHKQNGGNKKIGRAWGGRELQGKVYHEFPDVSALKRTAIKTRRF